LPLRVYVKQEFLYNVAEVDGCILNDVTHSSSLTAMFATAGSVTIITVPA